MRWLPPASCPGAHAESLHAVAVRDRKLELLPMAGGPVFLRAGRFVAEVTNDGVGARQPFGESAGDRFDANLAGRWPEAVFMHIVENDGRASIPIHATFRFRGGAWQPVAGDPAVDVRPWGQRLLALGLRSGLRVLDEPFSEPPRVDQRLCPDALSTLPGGEVLVAGGGCDSDAPRAQRFQPGDLAGTVDDLPLVEGCTHYTIHGALLLATGAWVWGWVNTCQGQAEGHAYLARFDGATWHLLPPQPPARITSLSVAPDGTVWIAGKDGLFRRPPDGAFDRVPLPCVSVAGVPLMPQSARQVVARSADDVWVAALYRAPGRATHMVVLHSAEPRHLLELRRDGG